MTDDRAMSRIFTDENLLTWEAYASGGKYGLPDQPKIVFNCLSDHSRRARFIVHPGDEADAEKSIAEMPDERLRELLSSAADLDEISGAI